MSYFWWAVATFGVSTVAFVAVGFFLGGVPLLLAWWRIVAKAIVAVWENPYGKALIVGVLMFLLGSEVQKHKDDKEYAKRVAAFEQAQKDRDAKIAKDTETFVRKQIADETIAEQKDEKALVEYRSSLDPAAACRLGDGGTARLLRLWGVASPNLQRVRQAPKPRKTPARR